MLWMLFELYKQILGKSTKNFLLFSWKFVLTFGCPGGNIIKLTARANEKTRKQLKKIKKLLTGTKTCDNINELLIQKQQSDLKKSQRKIKKLLTNTWGYDRISKLLKTTKQRTLITEQWNNLERFRREHDLNISMAHMRFQTSEKMNERF